MGATDFQSHDVATNPDEAFKNCVKQAQYDYGHSGYTGSIAEKDNYVVIARDLDAEAAQALIDKHMNDEESVVNDKWGPAGAIGLGANGWIFFGWASS